jgi:hypothetical protein
MILEESWAAWGLYLLRKDTSKHNWLSRAGIGVGSRMRRKAATLLDPKVR